MRSLKESILSTTKVGKYDEWSVFKKENAHPTTTYDFKAIIYRAIQLKGPNVDLNWIDTSKITNMYGLFNQSDFNGDISDVGRIIPVRVTGAGSNTLRGEKEE